MKPVDPISHHFQNEEVQLSVSVCIKELNITEENIPLLLQRSSLDGLSILN